MSDSVKQSFTLPPEQQAIRDKCFHPSGTFIKFPEEEAEESIVARLERMVRLYPGHLAVKAGQVSHSYDELNLAANRIAALILSVRCQGSEPIMLLFEHGLDAIAAIFGVLKAGKFFVVLDPSFPLERMISILEDCQSRAILTNNRNLRLALQLVGNRRRMLLNVDTIAATSVEKNLGLPAAPDDIATLAYTSGSTGKPKGLIKTHRYILYGILVQHHYLKIAPNDRLSLIHSLSFGSGQVNFFQALLNGAALFVFDPKVDGVSRLANWLRSEAITIFHAPPALFRQLAEVINEKGCPHLRLINLSGAPVTPVEIDLFRTRFGATTELGVLMGTTETHALGYCLVDPNFSYPEVGVPIGYPVPGKTILLLDDNGQEVECGQVGEIAVKSRYLTAGYWRLPELTKAKFLPDPNGGDEKIYLTGDRARQLSDGFMIHMGRKDSQVKIRGYRVEIFEIEMALREHPDLEDVGVVAWDREPGEKQLVAYVVSRRHPPPLISELFDLLEQKLPRYMMPSAFVFLESLPLTNGKLDRAALPKPEGERPEFSQPYVAPRSEVEQELVCMWEEVLEVRPIGIHDSFFELGGHSLAASRVISRVIQTFKLKLPLKTLFDAPTVAEMAAIITQNQTKRAREEDLARMLSEVEAMSEEEADRIVKNRTGEKT